MSDAKEPAPVLVKKDGERQPVASTMTRDELFAGFQMLAESIRAGNSAGDGKIDAVADAVAHIKADLHKGDYNVANFPDRSVFNPLGEHPTFGLPKPALDGEVFWVGTPVDEREHTREELELFNQLRPGVYHGGLWKVRDLAPGTSKRALLVTFPCVEADERAALPGDYWDSNAPGESFDAKAKRVRKGRLVTGYEVMLREMVEAASAAVA